MLPKRGPLVCTRGKISTTARPTCNNIIVEVFDERLYHDSRRQRIALGCLTKHCYFNLLYYNIDYILEITILVKYILEIQH